MDEVLERFCQYAIKKTIQQATQFSVDIPFYTLPSIPRTQKPWHHSKLFLFGPCDVPQNDLIGHFIGGPLTIVTILLGWLGFYSVSLELNCFRHGGVAFVCVCLEPGA